MANGLEFDIKANVSSAVAGLQKVESELGKTATPIKNVESSFTGLSKAVNDALDRINKSIDANVDKAITDFQKLDQQVDKVASSAGKSIQTLSDKFQKFGGISTNAAAKSLDQLYGKVRELPKPLSQATFALTNFGRVVQDAPFGIIGVANNIDPLIQSFIGLKRETGSAKAAFAALGSSLIGPAGLAIAVSAITSLMIVLSQAKQKAASAAKKLKEEEDVFVNTLAKEKVELDNLYAIATSANVPLLARKEAIKQLRSEYGEYLKNFSDEKILAGDAADAYQRLAAALINVARAKAAEAQQIENSKKILENEGKIAKIREKAQKDAAGARPDIGTRAGGEAFFREGTQERKVENIFKEARQEVEKIRKENQSLEEDQKRLADAILKNQVEPFKKAKEQVKKIKDGIDEVSGAILGLSAAISDSFGATNLQMQKASKMFDPANVGTPSSATAPGGIQQTQGQALDAARRLDFLIKSIKFDKQIAQAAELQSIIDGGINSGIDQFFNALANNQNPFDALIQGVKRLIVELISAVAKALILKALTSGLTAGTSNLSGIAKIAGRATLLGGGVPHFATGGFVSQPTMATIAENGPEFVLRPDQLGAIMNMSGGSDIIPEIKLRGEDMFIMLNRVEKRRGRNF